MPMKKEQVDLENAVVWIPGLEDTERIAEVPLTDRPGFVTEKVN
jgi:hypothetical protein